MSSTDVQRAVDSAPNPSRDFDAEIRQLLAQADEAREQAASIDLASATEAMLMRTAAAADDAIARGSHAADGAREKVHEQQERFKTNVIARGGSLEEEPPIGWARSGGGRSTLTAQDANKPEAGNKYSMMMDRRKTVQDKERME